ncbi:B12-binding domain-containing radical SAM protein [Candidatus Saganbacteria bacterium]|nr:B12-binding domain-containing radical SAM protein [Candidatus Saganbacteria bacterium]
MKSRILLVGGLGHTDLSGKVPRPSLLMLRKALRSAGHEGVVANYSTALMPRMFPAPLVGEAAAIYERSIKPVVVEGRRPHHLLRFLWDLSQLRKISRKLADTEKRTFGEVGKEIARRVKEEKFDAVGFSLFLGGSTEGAIAIANSLRREFSDLPLIFGGPQTTFFSRTIYQETNAPTALVLGEGELALVGIAEILDSLKAGKLDDLSRVPNVVFKAQDGRIMATARKRLPLKEWVDLSRAPYEEADFEGLMRYAFIETSRGCHFLCNFCAQPLLSGRERYSKPAGDIVDEMVILNNKFGLTHFELVGSSTSPRQAGEIAEALAARGLERKFNWVLFMRGRDERPSETDLGHLMKRIKRAGGLAIFFGVEAADDGTLKKMAKKEGLGDIKAAMLAAKQAGIAAIGSFIYPYPGMPANEAELIVQFLEDVRPLSAPVQALGLFPGTYCSEHAAEIGVEITYPDRLDRVLRFLNRKPKPTMQSPEVLRYLLRYPLILSLPMRLWPPLPYKIDGKSFGKYVGETNDLQRKIGELGILLGFSHSHYLISQVLQMPPREFFERMFYCSLTGDPVITNELIARFNQGIAPSPSSLIPGS